MRRVRDRIAGLILAAGASTRMGEPKQLLHVDGRILLGQIVDETLKSELDQVLLILGYQADQIKRTLRPILTHEKLKIVENTAYRTGVSSSIIAGLSVVTENFDHVMVLLADIPHISSRLINLLLHRYLDSRLPLGAIYINSRRSHPVIFGRALYPELFQLRGDEGARALFQKYGDRTCLVEPGFFYDDRDIDTPEDYAAFKRSRNSEKTETDKKRQP